MARNPEDRYQSAAAFAAALKNAMAQVGRTLDPDRTVVQLARKPAAVPPRPAAPPAAENGVAPGVAAKPHASLRIA